MIAVFHAAALPYEGLSVFAPAIVTVNSIVSGTVSVASACFSYIQCEITYKLFLYGKIRRSDSLLLQKICLRNPVDPYGLAKAQAEQHLEMLSEIHGLNFVTVVPHNVIGVGQRYFRPL